MATGRQIRTFRKNAKQSTGPRTPEGKARSSQNARQHGLFARDAVLPDENPEDFLQLITDLEQELEAGSAFERRLVHHIACTEWRMRRLVRLETGALMSQLEEERLCAQRIQAEHGEENAPPPADPYQQSTKELGAVVAGDRDTPVLLTLSLYEARLTRKYFSLLKHLRLTQNLRRPAEAVEPEPLPAETEARPPTTGSPPEPHPPSPSTGQATPQGTGDVQPENPASRVAVGAFLVWIRFVPNKSRHTLLFVPAAVRRLPKDATLLRMNSGPQQAALLLAAAFLAGQLRPLGQQPPPRRVRSVFRKIPH